jgi:hypothetical protein
MSDVKRVQGTDIWGKSFVGELVSVINLANVAIIKTGDDRLNVTEAYISDIKEVNQ